MSSHVAGDPDQIKQQLGEVLDLQDDGKNNMTIKLKKKALQGAQSQCIGMHLRRVDVACAQRSLQAGGCVHSCNASSMSLKLPPIHILMALPSLYFL